MQHIPLVIWLQSSLKHAVIHVTKTFITVFPDIGSGRPFWTLEWPDGYVDLQVFRKKCEHNEDNFWIQRILGVNMEKY